MKFVKFAIATCVFAIIFWGNSFAQSESQISSRHMLELEGKPLNKEMIFNVAEGITQLAIQANGIISSGTLTLTLFDPQGNKSNRLQLSAGKGGRAKGNIQEEMDAIPGDWKLKIENDTATGQVMIEFLQNKSKK